MLEIDEKVCTRLVASGALLVNTDCDDVFIGLTHAETQFFCAYELEPGDGHATAEAALYQNLG